MNEEKNIRRLPKGWMWVKLKDISESIQYGYTESSSNEAIGPKFLRITDIQDNRVIWDKVPYCKIDEEVRKKYLLNGGDLVFARTGATVGKSYLLKGNIPEAVFASYLIRVRVNHEIYVNYLSYFFQSTIYWAQITEGQVGIGQPNVNGTKLGQLSLPLPPISIQQAIVAKVEELFSEIDKGIEQLKTARQQLKTYRQAVLKWAFEGRLTNEDVKDGELPEGWRWVTINEIGKIKGGKRLPPKHQYSKEPTGFFYIMAGNLKDGTVKNRPTYIEEETYQALEHYKVIGGEVYITIVGACIGDAGVIPQNIGIRY